ncbi:metallophosphoesterase family protein [Catalinimonas niigatensis]|uniref:metallophosphoesterase family protein n=1 Tax=Catalinimonas niigatensis TaxID=1397264 RepID=UPI0026670AEC|nr:metallophosphoesterase family protein [Catalinimonas niigatensis]WPP52141.1 metallophosphoesterase family protein [Catalinimonas niigatensis]
MKILLFSDTHSYIDETILSYCEMADEVWHAGDIGDFSLVERIQEIKPLRAVYGNIDGEAVRSTYPEDLWFEVEGLSIWMTHIGGYPPRYNSRVRKVLSGRQPDIFVCGHSHILKVLRDQERRGMLCLNPGAAGKHGFQKVRTMLRFELQSGKVKGMEAIELGKK